MTTQDCITLIQNVGFPIVMVGYFILRFERILRDNTIALRTLQECLIKTVAKLNTTTRGDNHHG